MDFVNKAFAQLADLFRTMSPGTRLATVLMLVLVVVSLAYLWQYPATGGGEYLLSGRPFAQHELTAIEAAFAKAGLGKSEIVGNRIRIPRGQKEVYLAALADSNALPADFYKYLDEASAADNPFSSTKAIELRRWNAKQKELALIISRMKNIESATVQYDEESRRGLSQAKQKTAMVAVQTAGGRLDDEQVKAIRNVVASAYAGLDRHHISITDMTSGYSYGGAIGPDGVSEDDSIYAAHKQRYERDWQRKIVEQLSYIPGVLVGINVELNPEVERSSNSVKWDPKPVAVKTTEETKEATTQTPQVAGRPGAQSNGVGNTPVDLRQGGGSASESTTTESRSDVQNIAGHETQHIRSVALIPKRVTASIDIPASYYPQVWNRRNPPAAGQPAKAPDAAEVAKIETETQNRIKEAVRNLLPDVAQGTNPYPHIVVSTYADIPATPPEPPSLAATSTTWLADNWQTVALVGVGLGSLLMLRSMVRSPAGAPAKTSAAPAERGGQPRLAVHEPAEEEAPEPVRILKPRFGTPGPDLKTELHEIVKENPDAAASVLRAWIGEAA